MTLHGLGSAQRSVCWAWLAEKPDGGAGADWGGPGVLPRGAGVGQRHDREPWTSINPYRDAMMGLVFWKDFPGSTVKEDESEGCAV